VTLCAKCHRTVHGNNGFSRYETRKAQNRLEANL
jgi:predicted HNH restriction endonuclease